MATTHLLRPLLRPKFPQFQKSPKFPRFRTLASGITLGLSLTTLHQSTKSLHGFDFDSTISTSEEFLANSRDEGRGGAKRPKILRSGGGLNPKAVGQISSGSVTGLLAGLAVSVFSRTLAALIGILIVGVQYLSTKGINIIPYKRLQRHIQSIDLHSLIQENVAFKVSFGMTFALAAFMKF